MSNMPPHLLALVFAAAPAFALQAQDTPAQEMPAQGMPSQATDGGTIQSDVPEVDVQPDDQATLDLEEHFEQTFFGPDGEVYFEDGVMNLGMGDPMTGVKIAEDVDLDALLGEDWENYEITFEAQRVEGYDFFVCFTFPVAHEGNVSLVMGGWSGSVVGISCLDRRDAANNGTTRMIQFANEQWYEVSVRVTPDQIVCSCDGEEMFTVLRERHEVFSTRGEVTRCEPMGFASYRTHAAIRNFSVTQLDTEE